MTAPVDPAAVFALDQRVIDAGRALLDALTADPYDQAAVDAAKAALQAANAARWPGA